MEGRLRTEAHFSLKYSSWAVLPCTLFFFILLGALTVQCTKWPEAKAKGSLSWIDVDVKSPQKSVTLLLDLFVFDDGAHKRLDSYTRVSGTTHTSVASSEGDKMLVVIANAPWTEEELSQIDCYEVLDDLQGSLLTERADAPLMSGEAVFTAGQDAPVTIVLRPLLAKIQVTGLSVRLKGQYKGVDLKNVQAYLTEVNGSCELMRTSGFRPREVLNPGRLRTADLDRMRSPQLLHHVPSVSRRVDGETTYETFSLYCYPNDVVEETAGSPFTTLVIQGEVEGRTWYYPIPINRAGSGYIGGRPGIDRNTLYVMDICISGPGSDDPATPVDAERITTVGSARLHPGEFLTAHVGERIHVWCEVYPETLQVQLDEDLLDMDRERGIYDYTIDPDGHGVALLMTGRGTGMVYMEVEEPVNEAFLCVIVVQ